MSDTSSGSVGREWTLVNNADGDHPSDEESSGSSCEFVHLENTEAVSYHHEHKSRSSSLDSDIIDSYDIPPEPTNADPEPQQNLHEMEGASAEAEQSHPSPQDNVDLNNSVDSLDDLPEAEDTSSQQSYEVINSGSSDSVEPDSSASEDEMSGPISSEAEVLDGEVVSALTDSEVNIPAIVNEDENQRQDGADVQHDQAEPKNEDGCGFVDMWEDNHDNMWFWDDEVILPDSCGESDMEEIGEGEVSQTRTLQSQESSEIEELALPDEEDDLINEDKHLPDEEEEIQHPSINLLRGAQNSAQVSECESDMSDIVKIDSSMADDMPSTSQRNYYSVPPRSRAEFRRYSPSRNIMSLSSSSLMQVSASSSSSNNSASRFQFIHPLPVYPLPDNHRYVYPRQQPQEEEIEVPGDVDDRCESDISGVVHDDSDIDLSSISYNLDDLEIFEGDVVRSYKHRPNANLNSFLTIMALLSLFTVLGVAFGHYLGTTRDATRRQQQAARVLEIQDDYLQCLRQQDMLQAKASITDVEKIAAVTAVWKEKYEELIIEKVELDVTLRTLQAQMSVDLKDAESQVDLQKDETSTLITDIAELEGENRFFKERLVESEEKVKILQEDLKALEQTNEQSKGSQSVESVGVPAEDDAKEVLDEANPHESTSSESEDLVIISDQPSLEEIHLMQDKVNALELENQELREQVARLRYSRHQYTQPSQVGEVELKDTVNMLALENDDLKTVVARLRYGKNDLEVDGEDVMNLETPQQMSAEEKRSLFKSHKQLPVMESETETITGSPCPDQQVPETEVFKPTFLTCLSLLVPEVDLNDVRHLFSSELLGNITQPLATQIQFIQNITADAQFSKVITQKWSDLKAVVESTSASDVKEKAQGAIDHLQDTISDRWNQFNDFVHSEDFQKVKESTKGKFDSVVEKIKNSSALSKYEEFVNKTKESVSELSDSIKKTWTKVKNLTGDFLHKNKVLKDIGDSVNKNIKHISKSVNSGWKKAQRHIRKKGWIPHVWGKNKNKNKENNLYKGKEPQQQHSRQYESFEGFEGLGGAVPNRAAKKEDFQDKPEHKQKQSSNIDHEKYEEYWKQAEFEPDDFFQEGFFEHNHRQWHKHQNKARKLHGRLNRLNEDIFLTMDDDDIEDIYEDFDDFQDDVDDLGQPESLMTWLTCQVRWWKSRLHRKHSNEDIVKGCYRQLMHWQLRALCKPLCNNKGTRKCKKELQEKDRALYQDPVCYYYYTVILPSNESPQASNQGNKNKQGTPSTISGTGKTKRRVYTVTLDDGQDHTEGEIQTDSGKIKYSMNIDYPEPAMEENNSTAFDDETRAKWVFERAEDRESHHHDGTWSFHRHQVRSFERNKPWYYRRAEKRAAQRAVLKNRKMPYCNEL